MRLRKKGVATTFKQAYTQNHTKTHTHTSHQHIHLWFKLRVLAHERSGHHVHVIARREFFDAENDTAVCHVFHAHKPHLCNQSGAHRLYCGVCVCESVRVYVCVCVRV